MIKSLSRKDNHRKSLTRNLATSLILYEEMHTTLPKAKVLRPIVEGLINRAKKNDLTARRALLAYLFDKNATKKVFEVLVSRYRNKPSGFVKIVKIGPRLGDSAPMALIKLDPEIVIPNTEVNPSNKLMKDKNAKENSKAVKAEESSKTTKS